MMDANGPDDDRHPKMMTLCAIVCFFIAITGEIIWLYSFC